MKSLYERLGEFSVLVYKTRDIAVDFRIEFGEYRVVCRLHMHNGVLVVGVLVSQAGHPRPYYSPTAAQRPKKQAYNESDNVERQCTEFYSVYIAGGCKGGRVA